MAEEKQQGFFDKVIDLVKKAPLVAISMWLVYYIIRQDARYDEKEKRRETRDSLREANTNEQLMFYRDLKKELLEIKELELNKRYEIKNDSI